MIEITDAAAKRIQTAMVDEGRTEGGLRVGIKAGGCNGFSYVFKWEHAPSSDDEVFASPSGARIFVDPKSYKYLERHGAGLRPEHARAVTGVAQSQRHERVWLRPVVRRLAIRGAGHVCHTEGRGDRRQSVPHPALATQAVADARRGIVVVVRALMPESNHFQPSPADRPSRPLVVVSNREPYLHSIGEGGTVTWEPTTGGVAVALDALMRDRGGVWIAHGAGDADRRVVDADDRVLVPPDAPSYALRRIWLTEAEERCYYEGFANEGLWPLCHVAHVKPVFRAADWRAYQEVNKRFASAVEAELPDLASPVFIQDYHLTLVAKYLRAARPDVRIALFWHIPFPNPDQLRICPFRREIMEGLLACDLLAFQLDRDRRNFLAAARTGAWGQGESGPCARAEPCLHGVRRADRRRL